MCGYVEKRITRAWNGSIAPEKPVYTQTGHPIRNRGMSCTKGIVCAKQGKHGKSMKMGVENASLLARPSDIFKSLSLYFASRRGDL